jgi:hypothetical protein
MIRIRPIRVEDAEGVVNVLNPLIRAGESTALDRVHSSQFTVGHAPARTREHFGRHISPMGPISPIRGHTPRIP